MKSDFHVPVVDAVIKEVVDLYGIAAAIGEKHREAYEAAKRGLIDEKQRTDNAERELKNERQRADNEKLRADELDAKYKALIETLPGAQHFGRRRIVWEK